MQPRSDFNSDFNVSVTEEQHRARDYEYNYRRGAAPQSVTRPGATPDGSAKGAAMAGTDVITYAREKPGMSTFVLEDGVVYHMLTGEVRSSGGKDLLNDLAAWFIDHDYDEESFFVRQAYFVGDDPYDALKRALRAEIDEAAWAELNSTISRPFPRAEHGRICLKVINHFGDEVQKVFHV